MTDAEQKLWRHLKRLEVNGTHFRRQATIGPYFADFACHNRRLVIEVDGSQHAGDRRAQADADRTEFMKARGYCVLRFWNNEVLADIEAVMNAIYHALNEAEGTVPPTPDPSPPRASRAGGGE